MTTTPNSTPPDPMLHLQRSPGGEGDAAKPCDVIQVRYTGTEGWQLLQGYFWPDFAATYSAVDLSPLITSSERVDPPVPEDVTPCDPARGVRGGTSMGNETAETPAEALLAFLTNPEQDGFVDSGYHEYVGDNLYTYTYAPDYDPELIATLITVERETDSWTVTGLYHSGC